MESGIRPQHVAREARHEKDFFTDWIKAAPSEEKTLREIAEKFPL